MPPSEPTFIEPDFTNSEEADVRYDLAGNPLPPLPKSSLPPPAPLPVPGMHFSAPPTAAPPAFTPPAAFTPPPGPATNYVPPPGSAPLPPSFSPTARTSSGATLYFGLGAGLIMLVGLIFAVGALKPKMVAAPTSYSTYTSIDNTFSCDRPAGWTMHETGATSGSMATVTFESGQARVRVVSDAEGSLMGDIVGSGNANLPPDQQIPAVQKLHVMDAKQLSDSLPDYKEDTMQSFQSGCGDARVSEWTAGGSLHGYRVTLLGHEREFTVICLCPERNWALLKPAFLRIINSIKPGTGS